MVIEVLEHHDTHICEFQCVIQLECRQNDCDWYQWLRSLIFVRSSSVSI